MDTDKQDMVPDISVNIRELGQLLDMAKQSLVAVIPASIILVRVLKLRDWRCCGTFLFIKLDILNL